MKTLPQKPIDDKATPSAPRGEWTRGFGEFCMAVRSADLGGYRDPRLQTRAAGLSESIGSDGGFLIPMQFAQDLLFRIYSSSLAGRCQTFDMTGNALQIATIDQSSRANGSRYGGVSSAWLSGEGATLTASKPKLGRQELNAKKLGALCYASDELMSDVAGLGSFLTTVFTSEAVFMLDAALIGGSGAGEPLGVLNSQATLTVTKESGQASGTVTSDNLIQMHSRIPGPSRPSAVWLANEETEGYLARTFVPSKNIAGTENVGGQPLYVPASSDDDYPRILGHPILVTEQARALGTKGDIILADFSQMALGLCEMRVQMSGDLNFLTGETAWRFILRADSQSRWRVPITPLYGANQLSPFIVLENR